MKKLMCLILCFVMLFGTIGVAFAAEDTNDYPIIHVMGRQDKLPYVNKSGELIYPNELDADEIIEEVKACLPLLGEALVTNDYSEWVAKVKKIFAAYYTEMLPDKNGNVTNGSHVRGWSASYSGSAPRLTSSSNEANKFVYDWRLSPMDLADCLNEYIQRVKNSTGREKVSLFGRCFGCNIIAAYLYKYGHGDIDTVVFGASSVLGSEKISAAFSGHVAIHADTLIDYINSQEDLTDDAAVNELIFTLLEYLKSVYGLTVPMELATVFIKKIYPELAPSLLRVSYGRYPAMWALVSPDDYEEAKNFVFSGCEKEYAGLIEKIDSYYEVQTNLSSMLKQYHEEGMKIAVFAKYNLPMLPVSENSEKQSDDTVLTADASFGAVCADAGKTLTDAELKGVPQQYISADRVINASTCLFPDNTWFIKNAEHSHYNDDFYTLLSLICHSKTEVTVNTYEAYPSFLQCNAEDDTLSPLEASGEEADTFPFGILKNIFTKLKNFIEALIAMLKNK